MNSTQSAFAASAASAACAASCAICDEIASNLDITNSTPRDTQTGCRFNQHPVTHCEVCESISNNGECARTNNIRGLTLTGHIYQHP
jgi:hypothetical protein